MTLVYRVVRLDTYVLNQKQRKAVEAVLAKIRELGAQGIDLADARYRVVRALRNNRPLYLETGYAGGPGRLFEPVDHNDRIEAETLCQTSTRWFRLV